MASIGLPLFCSLFTLSTCSIVPLDDVTVVPTPSTYSTLLSADAANFLEAVVESFSVLLVSELGDNTFLIAAIMAMKYPRMVVFLGAMCALVSMTFVSILCGWAVSAVPRVYLYYCSLLVMWVFGIKMIVDGLRQREREPLAKDYEPAKRSEPEAKETAEELKLMEDEETGSCEQTEPSATFWRTFAEAFTITFVGEWGDRSQFATMVLTWNDNKFGIMLGSFLCHSMTTGLAVICGRLVASKISVRKVSVIGGVVFILFSFITFFKNNDVSFS